MTIKEAFDLLNKNQKATLLYAFEHGLSQHIELSDSRYIGVNINSKNLQPINNTGVWSYGEVKK